MTKPESVSNTKESEFKIPRRSLLKLSLFAFINQFVQFFKLQAAQAGGFISFAFVKKNSSPVAVGDTRYANVTLLMSGEGSNGAQNYTILDSSSVASTITRNGNITQGTNGPYGKNWSQYFNGTTDGVSFPANTNTDFATGDFTIEAWLYRVSEGSNTVLSKWGTGSGVGYGILFYTSAGIKKLSFMNGNGVLIFNDPNDFPLVTWTHIAISRSGNQLRMFVGGVLVATVTDSTNFGSNTALYVGTLDASKNYSYTGYISNLRIVKGSALYTASFTPSSSPLTAIAGTYLLTCHSNRFNEGGLDNLAATLIGTPKIDKFGPYYEAYSVANIGGSAYLDGTGDYLTVPYSTAFNMPNDFTIECWVYPDVQIGNWNGIVSNYSTWAANGSVCIFCGHVSASTTQWCISFNGIFPFITSASPFKVNQWSHIALVRSGSGSNNIKFYVNGVLEGQSTSTATVAGTQNNIWIGTAGDDVAGGYFGGFISNLRIVKDVAVYTGAFKPPTKPLTTAGSTSATSYPVTTNVNTSFAAANTSLLCSFTNGGIIDSTGKTTMYTQSTAQVSTAQKKFGTSSVLFAAGTGVYFPPSSYYVLNNDPFTLECFLYMTEIPPATQTIGYNTTGGGQMTLFGWSDSAFSLAAWRTFFSITSSAGTAWDTFWLRSSGNGLATSSVSTALTTPLSINTWYHLAIVRPSSSSYSINLYVNGVLSSTLNAASVNFVFGGDSTVQNIGWTGLNGYEYSVRGYMDEVRITKGIARYTANFTPPSAPFYAGS
jgi:hypothetical protein